MKANQFRLQKVLEVRELKEKEHQKTLGLSKLKLASKKKELQTALEKKRQFLQSMLTDGNIHVSEVLRCYDYLSALVEEIDDQNEAVQNLQEQVNAGRMKLLQATKDKKVLQNLKEKVLKSLMEEDQKKEQQLLDEIALRGVSSLTDQG